MKAPFKLICLFIAALLIFAFYISKGNVLNYLLKPYLETLLSAQSGLNVEIEKLNLSLVRISFEAEGITLKSKPPAHEQEISVIIPSVLASIQLRELILGKISLHKAVFDKPSATINIHSPPPKKVHQPTPFSLNLPWGQILSFKFNQIQIVSGELFLKTEGVEVIQRDLNLSISPHERNAYKIQYDSVESSISLRDFNVPSESISAEGIISTSGLIKGRINIINTQLQNYSIPLLQTAFSIKDRQVNIDKFLISPPTGLLEATGHIKFNRKYVPTLFHVNLNGIDINMHRDQDSTNRYHIKAAALSLEKLVDKKFDAKGTGELTGEVTLSKEKVRLSLQSTINDLSIRGFYLGKTTSNITASGEQLKVDISYEHPKRPARGQLQATLHLKDRKVYGTGAIRAQKVSLFEEYLAEAFIPFTVSEDTITLLDSYVVKKQGHLLFSGHMKPNFINLNVTSKDLSIEEFDHIPTFFRGAMTVSASVSGSPEKLSATSNMTFKNTWVGQNQLADSTISARLSNNELHISSNFFEKQLVQTGHIKLTGAHPYSFSAKLNQFDFKPYLYFIHKGYLNIQGLVNGHIDISGTLKDKYIERGEILLSNLFIKSPDLEFKNAKPISVSILNNEVHLKSLHLEGTNTSFKASGEKTADERLNFKLEGPLDMALLSLLSSTVNNSQGKAYIACRVGGTTKHPTLFGNFTWENGAIEINDFPHTIEQIAANITFGKDKIVINKAHGMMGGDDIRISGDIGLHAGKSPSINLQAFFSENRLQIPKWLTSTVNGTLYLRGTEKPYLLGGNLFIRDAIYRENIEWKTQILSLKRQKYLPKIKEKDIPLFLFDIALNAPGHLFVNNDIANLEASANLNLKGDNRNSILLGKIELIEGTANFKNNKFKLSSTTIFFENPIEINPRFSINAETLVQNYKILLGVEGTLSQYDIHLTSHPTLPEGDIVSLLTFGATRSELEKQGGLDVTSVELGSIFFGGLQKAVQSAARQTLGVQFSLSPSYSDTKHATVPRLFVGKRLTKKVDATFSSTLDKSDIFSDKEFNLKYNLNRNLSVTGVWEDQSDETIQDNSSIGVDLRIQFEFR